MATTKRKIIMREVTFRICCVVVAAVMTLAAANAPAAEELSDILREAKWDGIVGTWIDADTKGAGYKVAFAWKIKDRVLESTSWEENGKKQTGGLMAVNGKTGKVFHMGADSADASSLGE